MAVVECKECGGKVSTAARACPHCGAAPMQQTSIRTVAVTVFVCIAGILGYAFVSSNDDSNDGGSSAERPAMAIGPGGLTQTDAIAAAQMLVTERLKDPESAQFSQLVYRQSGHVCGYVNAKNSFGGYMGDKGFVLDVSAKQLLMEDEHERFISMWNARCKI